MSLRDLAAKATPGPWTHRPNPMREHLSNVYAPCEAYGTSGLLAPIVLPDDARLIALAPEMAVLLAATMDALASPGEDDDLAERLLARFAELEGRT